MKVTWYRSATVGITSNSKTKILCDPWITDGAFIGSWFHYPQLEGFEFEELTKTKWDGIYISHLHADHFDRKLVAAIGRAQPDCKVIIPKFAHSWLFRAVSNCGFKENRIIEVENGKSISFGSIDVTVFTADYCNPSVCGVSIPCTPILSRQASIDSLALFESDGKRILNANDALAVQSVSKLWQIIGEVDLLLGHYGGAGPYPQCFSDLSKDKVHEEAKRVATSFIQRLADSSEKLSAKFVMPYAGQYLLGGRLSKLNKFRSVFDLGTSIDLIRDKTNSIPIAIAPFSDFDLNKEIIEKNWIEPSIKSVESYINKISEIKYPYELKKEIWHEGEAYLNMALGSVKDEYLKRFHESGFSQQHSISISSENLEQTINFDGKKVDITSGAKPEFDSSTMLKFDERLLKRLILRRPGYKGFTQYHFNQAEIGSHIEWRRNGEYNPVTGLLNFMHTYA